MEGKNQAREALTYEPGKVAWATAEFIEQKPGFSARAIIYFLSMLLITGGVFSSLFEVAGYVEARGSLTTEKSVFPVIAPVNFRVARLLVKENDPVKAGQVLVTSIDYLSDTDQEAIRRTSSRIRQLIRQETAGECESCAQEIEAATRTAFAEAENSSLRDVAMPIQKLVRDYVSARRQYESYTQVTMNLKRQVELAERKLQEIRRRKAESLLAMQAEQLTSEIVSGRAQLAEKKQQLETQLSDFRSKLEVSLDSLPAILDDHQAKQSARAPVDGVLLELKVSGPGQFVSAGQEMMQVLPSSSDFLAELLVENRDISRIRAGMPVRLRLDALPERDFGSVSGKVKTVPEGTTGRGLSSSGTFKVLVSLDSQSVTKDGIDHSFRFGMTLTGYVVTEHRSLLMLVIRRLLNIKDDVFPG